MPNEMRRDVFENLKLGPSNSFLDSKIVYWGLKIWRSGFWFTTPSTQPGFHSDQNTVHTFITDGFVLLLHDN